MRFEPHLALAMFDPFVLSCVACVPGRAQELSAVIWGRERPVNGMRRLSPPLGLPSTPRAGDENRDPRIAH